MNAGRMSAISFIRSGRRPLGASIYVGGKSDTRLNQTNPLPLAERTNFALAVVGVSWAVVSVSVYFCQPAPIGGVWALATVVLPSSSTIAAETGMAKPIP